MSELSCSFSLPACENTSDIIICIDLVVRSHHQALLFGGRKNQGASKQPWKTERNHSEHLGMEPSRDQPLTNFL